MQDLAPAGHLSIGFEPEEDEGFEVPHDVHLSFLTPEVTGTIQ